MTSRQYTDWWGEAEVVSLKREQYMGIVADLAAAESQLDTVSRAHEAASREVEELREALGYYGEHRGDCNAELGEGFYPCTCGFSKAARRKA